MAKLEIGTVLAEMEARMGRLSGSVRREAAKRMLEAGAAVLERGGQSEIAARHIKTGAMRESYKRTEVREGLDGSEIYVYAQGEDWRGVRNEMKNTIINTGYWQKRGRRNVKKDPFVQRMMRSRDQAVRKAMEDAYIKCLDEAGLK